MTFKYLVSAQKHEMIVLVKSFLKTASCLILEVILVPLRLYDNVITCIRCDIEKSASCRIGGPTGVNMYVTHFSCYMYPILNCPTTCELITSPLDTDILTRDLQLCLIFGHAVVHILHLLCLIFMEKPEVNIWNISRHLLMNMTFHVLNCREDHLVWFLFVFLFVALMIQWYSVV